MKNIIAKVSNLSHKYQKDWAVRNINFEIDKNGVLGLLGSNGAGKSTTMNILCGVLNQTEGTVIIGGINIQKEPERAKQLIGFLPQNAPLYMDLTVDEYLTYCAFLRKVDKKKLKRIIAEVKEKCGLTNYSKRLIKNLSGGYRQRVGIAQAIIHSPKLVVLDEPTNGLDPNQITEVRKLIKEIGEKSAVIFSSHILSEIEATCKDVKMIEDGLQVFSGSIETFNNYIQSDCLIVSMESPPTGVELKSLKGVKAAEFLSKNKIRIQFESTDNISERIVRASVEKEWRLTELTVEKIPLEAIFAKLSINQNLSKK